MFCGLCFMLLTINETLLQVTAVRKVKNYFSRLGNKSRTRYYEVPTLDPILIQVKLVHILITYFYKCDLIKPCLLFDLLSDCFKRGFSTKIQCSFFPHPSHFTSPCHKFQVSLLEELYKASNFFLCNVQEC
jgi:hypothetical protein